MKKLFLLILILVSISRSGFAQTNPALFDLSTGPYSLTSWASTSAAGTYPANMIFHRITGGDPTLTTEMTTDYTSGYGLGSGPRVNGLGANGFSFVNSGSTNHLGTAVLGLNTIGRQNIQVSFTAGTVSLGTPPTRVYKIRLQYRVGTGTWTDVPGPVEYTMGTVGASQIFNPTTLPAECDNKAAVYVRWKYYFDSGSGARPELRVDEISVTSTPLTSTQTFTTFRTEPIDGVNGFSVNNEKFNTTRSQINSFVTWDKDYIYIAYSGTTLGGGLTDNERVIHFYIDTDPKPVATQGTGTTEGEAWRWTPTLPFSANFHYAFKTSDNSETKRRYDGAGWTNASFFTQNYKEASRNYWEIRIRRADLGNPKQINLVGYVMEDWDATATITGGLPSNLFTDNTTQGSIAFNPHFLNVSFIDKMTPASPFTNDNHGWSLRLKAKGGSLSDSSLMAGMFTNATNGFDIGIDHPKAPSTPNNYINVSFPRASWTSLLGPNYERDFRARVDLSASTASWDFTVVSDYSDSITLSAASFEDIPTNYAITLKDLVNNQETNLRTSSYKFKNSAMSNSRNFELIIGVTFAGPMVSVTPTSLDFGNVKTNVSKTLPVVIKNLGDQPLDITSMSVSGGVYSYLFGSTTAVIQPNDTIVREIKFSPDAAMTFPGSFTIRSNDPVNPSVVVSLTGVGVTAVPGFVLGSDSVSFGNVIAGTSSQNNLMIANRSGDGVNLIIRSITITGSDSVAFNYLGSTPVTISPSDSAFFSFSFLPRSVRYYGAVITIRSNASDSVRSIPVGGFGTNSELSNTFPGGWNLMSIPLTPVSNLTSEILSSIPFYYLYTHSDSGYSSSTTMNPGYGYWLGIEAPHSLNLSGTPVVGNQTKSLRGGWNLIASPFTNGTNKANIRILQNGNPTPFTIEEAVAANLVQRPIYKYTTATKNYDTTNALMPWNGHWFFTQATNLSILYTVSAASSIKPPEAIEFEVTPDNWFVTITTTKNGVSDKLLEFGTNELATDGFDNRFDLAKAPISPASDAVESYFVQSGWSNYTDKFGSNIQSPYSVNPAKSWSFRVVSSSSGLVKISWLDILAQIPQEIRNNYRFIISGPGLPQTNMLTSTSFEFNAVAGTFYQFVINSTLVGVEDEMMNLDFKLGQNYPNPFNPSTTINFSVKESGLVSLKIYDILGNEVVTLVNDVKQPGQYEVKFEASNLPSGTYIYKLVQGKNSEIKKLMLLK